MGPPGLINLLIYAVCSVFVTTHTTPVPVHSLERPPTNIVHGNQHACSLPMQDQQESMQFIPLNASAPPVGSGRALGHLKNKTITVPISPPPPFSFHMMLDNGEGGQVNLSSCPARGERGRTSRAELLDHMPPVPSQCVHERLGHIAACALPGTKPLLVDPHMPGDFINSAFLFLNLDETHVQRVKNRTVADGYWQKTVDAEVDTLSSVHEFTRPLSMSTVHVMRNATMRPS